MTSMTTNSATIDVDPALVDTLAIHTNMSAIAIDTVVETGFYFALQGNIV